MRDITGGQTLPSKPSFDILVLPDKPTRTESCTSLQTQSTLTGAHDESTSNDKPALLGSQASVQTSSTLIDNHIRVDRAQNHDTNNRGAVMSSSKMAAKEADGNQPRAHAATNSNRDNSRPSTGLSSQSRAGQGFKATRPPPWLAPVAGTAEAVVTGSARLATSSQLHIYTK